MLFASLGDWLSVQQSQTVHQQPSPQLHRLIHKGLYDHTRASATLKRGSTVGNENKGHSLQVRQQVSRVGFAMVKRRRHAMMFNVNFMGSLSVNLVCRFNRIAGNDGSGTWDWEND